MNPHESIIRRLRTERGWSQEELANRAGVSQGLISHIEHGKPIGGAIARALSVALEIPFEQFAGMISNANPDTHVPNAENREIQKGAPGNHC